MEMDDNKRRRNMILYVLIAFVVYLVLSTVLFPNIGHTQQITKTDYSTFVKALDKKSDTLDRKNEELNRHLEACLLYTSPTHET